MYGERTVTPEIEAAVDAVDRYAREFFPCHYMSSDIGEYSLEDIVTREFDVFGLMTGLGVFVDPDYGYRQSPYVKGNGYEDFEAAHVISQIEDWWEKDLGEIAPEVDPDFDSETLEQGLCILLDSSAMGDLLHDYFSIEQASWTDAHEKLSEYGRLLSAADEAFRAAGWEL